MEQYCTVKGNSTLCLPKVKHDDDTVNLLKVPKRENFSLAFFALSKPIWACDVGTAKKIEIFYQLTADFDVFWFFAAY